MGTGTVQVRRLFVSFAIFTMSVCTMYAHHSMAGYDS
jgi:hypothetical protein